MKNKEIGAKITVQDMHQIASFHRIVKNYIKIKRLLEQESPLKVVRD